MAKRIVFLVVLFWCSLAFAQHEHEFFTGEQFGVKWGVSPTALGYYWYIERADGFVIEQDATNQLEVSLNIQSAGTYVFYVRAWNFKADGTTIQYSGWATSLTHGIVDGVVTPWQIKVKLRPVGPLIFDDYPVG